MSSEAPRPEPLKLASARTFTPRAVRWIVAIGIVSLLATLLLSVLTTGKEPSAATANPNAFSYSAVGHRAFVTLLERLGIGVTVSRHRSAEKSGPGRPLFVIEPDDDTPELEHLTRLVEVANAQRTPMVIALPKWTVTRRASDERWANRIELVSPYRVSEAFAAIYRGLDDYDSELFESALIRVSTARGTVLLGTEQTGWEVGLTPGQYLPERPDFEPLVTVDDDGITRTLLARVRGTTVYVLSDPDVLNTMGLGEADHAPLAVALVTELLGADEIVVDEINHGFEKVETIWQELFTFPLVLVTLHLAGLLALVLWAAMARFGKPEARPPRVPSGKQTLLDNTATLLALGHHAGYGAKRYFDTTLRVLARAYGIPPEATVEARIEQLSAIATRRGHGKADLRQLAFEVGALADRGGARDEHRARELARRIYFLRKELVDGHRSDS